MGLLARELRICDQNFDVCEAWGSKHSFETLACAKNVVSLEGMASAAAQESI